MKNIAALICFLIVGTGFSQEIVVKDGLYTENDLAYTGKYTLFFQNKKIRELLTIKEGKLNGEVIKYHANGNKWEVEQYENSLKVGLWTRFNKEGKIIAEASYKQNKKDGNWNIYNDKGIKLFEMKYTDGEKTGIWIQRDEKGNVIKTSDYTLM